MITPRDWLRIWRIKRVALKYIFSRQVIPDSFPVLRLLTYVNPYAYCRTGLMRAERFRLALEELGPIFVKFGQLLSTRRDLLPDDVADELEKLQDQVPPFSGEQARLIIEKALAKPIESLFKHVDLNPLASASIAQVHAAELFDGRDVIIKVLRPNIHYVIHQDLRLMYRGARLLRRFWRHGKRLRPVEFVREFEATILDELDLSREAANASLLRRNFEGSSLMYVPEIYWPYVTQSVLVMERIYGVRINDMEALKAANTNMRFLAESGVEIFFTQVLRDSFFHADMHPGNIFVDISKPNQPRYLGVDFGIMGTLSPEDQHYLSANLLAFFKRDYRQVAVLHVESGWVPADTRIDQFESAIRTVCEPIFQRPLKEISFGKLLLQLFRTAERFKMNIQPQLMLLQKTLLSVEGLGRQLYPDLDLWQTAQPLLEKWAKQQRGPRQFIENMVSHSPEFIAELAHVPRSLNQLTKLLDSSQSCHKNKSMKLESASAGSSRRFYLGAGIGLVIASVASFAIPQAPLPYYGLGLGVAALIIAACLDHSSKKH